VRGVLVTPRWLFLLLDAWERCPEALAAARADYGITTRQ
jgi:hypothetical protein